MRLQVMTQRIMYKGNPFFSGDVINVLPGDEGKFAVCIARDKVRVLSESKDIIKEFKDDGFLVEDLPLKEDETVKSDLVKSKKKKGGGFLNG